MRAGAAVRKVAVPEGTPMAGYAARSTGSTGVHDPLTVRTLVVDGIALVVADVCAIHERTSALIRERAIGTVTEVVVAATHTHSGPCCAFGRLGPHVPGVHDDLVEAAVEAITDAAESAETCRLAYGAVAGLGIARNRRHADRAIDPEAQALLFQAEDGRTIATLLTYPCHPVVLDAANLEISADYVWATRSAIEAAFGGVCVWATGCAGDVNNGHSAEASFTADASGTRTFAVAEQIGRTIADAVATTRFTDVGGEEARFASERLALDLRPVDLDEIRRDREEWQRQPADGDMRQVLAEWIRWADAMLGEHPAHDDDNLPAPTPFGAATDAHWPCRVSHIDLGGVSIVCLPGEPFLEVADRIRADVTRPTLLLGYSDGVPGYLPVAHEYADGGYEVDYAHRYYGMPAGFEEGSAERVIASALALARQ